MKPKLLLVCICFLFPVAMVAQSANSCAYTFSFPQYSFQFCLTPSGTLAKLQSPIGVDHLDPTNPIEGWEYGLMGDVKDGGDINIIGMNIPAYGADPAVVTQPNGPGTLPIVFAYPDFGTMKETVTANPAQKRITFRLSGISEGPNVQWFEGNVYRIASMAVDGSTTNNFDVLGEGGLAYIRGGDAVLQGSQHTGNSCVLQGNYDYTCPNCSPICTSTLPYVGYGTLVTMGLNYKNGSQVTTYQIF